MHILLLNRECGFHGGVEQHVFDIASGLHAAGHTCDLGFGELTGRDDELWRRQIRCHPVAELGAESCPSTALRDLIHRLDPDVIYLHKAEEIYPAIASMTDIRGRRVAMVHDHDLVCPRRHKYSAWTGKVCHRPMSSLCILDGAWLRRSADGSMGFEAMGPKVRRLRAARELDRLIVASRFMADQLTTNGLRPERVSRLAPVPRRPLGDADGSSCREGPGERILFVGQLVRGKGVDLLLQALAKTVEAMPATIIGDGNARGQLERTSERLGLQSRVCFEGWVENSRLSAFYRQARCVVVPSRWPEPFGLVGLEAMAHGVPVVASTSEESPTGWMPAARACS